MIVEVEVLRMWVVSSVQIEAREIDEYWIVAEVISGTEGVSFYGGLGGYFLPNERRFLRVEIYCSAGVGSAVPSATSSSETKKI